MVGTPRTQEQEQRRRASLFSPSPPVTPRSTAQSSGRPPSVPRLSIPARPPSPGEDQTPRSGRPQSVASTARSNSSRCSPRPPSTPGTGRSTPRSARSSSVAGSPRWLAKTTAHSGGPGQTKGQSRPKSPTQRPSSPSNRPPRPQTVVGTVPPDHDRPRYDVFGYPDSRKKTVTIDPDAVFAPNVSHQPNLKTRTELMQKRRDDMKKDCEYIVKKEVYPYVSFYDRVHPEGPRTTLLKTRKANELADLEAAHDAWLAKQPLQFHKHPRPDEYVENPEFKTRSEMFTTRNKNQRETVGLARDVTEINVDKDEAATLAYIDSPKHKSRSEMMEKKKENLIQEKKDILEQLAGFQSRLDLYNKREEEIYLTRLLNPGGRMRSQLMAERKERYIEELMEAHRPPAPPPKFAEQEAPFWEMREGYSEERPFGGSRETMLVTTHPCKRKEKYNHTDPHPPGLDDFKQKQIRLPQKNRELIDKLKLATSKAAIKEPDYEFEPPKAAPKFASILAAYRTSGEAEEARTEYDMEETAPLYSSFSRTGVFDPKPLPKVKREAGKFANPKDGQLALRQTGTYCVSGIAIGRRKPINGVKIHREETPTMFNALVSPRVTSRSYSRVESYKEDADEMPMRSQTAMHVRDMPRPGTTETGHRTEPVHRTRELPSAADTYAPTPEEYFTTADTPFSPPPPEQTEGVEGVPPPGAPTPEIPPQPPRTPRAPSRSSGFQLINEKRKKMLSDRSVSDPNNDSFGANSDLKSLERSLPQDARYDSSPSRPALA